MSLKWRIVQEVLWTGKAESNDSNHIILHHEHNKYGANSPYFFYLRGVCTWVVLRGHKTRDRNKSSLPQVPKELKMDRMSEEYAEELNNQLSREEQALANAANQRNQGN